MKYVGLAALVAGMIAANPVSAGAGDNTPAGWAGQYAGFTLGLSGNRSNPTVKTLGTTYFNSTDVHQLNPLASTNSTDKALDGSLLWGVNRQKENLVYGIEAELSLTNSKTTHDTGNIAYLSQPASTFNIKTEVSADWGLSLRPRLGYARGETLYFASAGLALKRFKYRFDFSDTFSNEKSNLRASRIVPGIEVGIGAEHKLKDGWSLRGGYLFSFYNNIADKVSNTLVTAGDGFAHEVDHVSHSLRFGLVRAF